MPRHCCCCREDGKTPEQYRLDQELKECRTKKEVKEFFQSLKGGDELPTQDGMFSVACTALTNNNLKMLKYVCKKREKIPEDTFTGGNNFSTILGQAVLANTQKCFDYLVEKQGQSVWDLRYYDIYEHALEMGKIRRKNNHELE